MVNLTALSNATKGLRDRGIFDSYFANAQAQAIDWVKMQWFYHFTGPFGSLYESIKEQMWDYVRPFITYMLIAIGIIIAALAAVLIKNFIAMFKECCMTLTFCSKCCKNTYTCCCMCCPDCEACEEDDGKHKHKKKHHH
ncbi:uncharacterized protein LOC111703649 [Eurytemora carolleeae]|uniref:uncharacterized protein LOC111703649 n=1 Tax=Eurytemora carolleeae TaxID=1294199 RepID=UPI000C77AE46|nr:uncharacterized protein LOC111703649 [Eurytemora carolleeae]|eukprot:XP_023331436.1 uncharacterized protein LOC111703649 [Eurytemora affinis]